MPKLIKINNNLNRNVTVTWFFYAPSPAAVNAVAQFNQNHPNEEGTSREIKVGETRGIGPKINVAEKAALIAAGVQLNLVISPINLTIFPLPQSSTRVSIGGPEVDLVSLGFI